MSILEGSTTVECKPLPLTPAERLARAQFFGRYGTHPIATTWDADDKPKKPVGLNWQTVAAAPDVYTHSPGMGLAIDGPLLQVADFDGMPDANGSKFGDSVRLMEAFRAALADDPLYLRLTGGWWEFSTSQGIHVMYVVHEPHPAPPKKLATHPPGPDGKCKTAVELLSAGMQWVPGTPVSANDPAVVTAAEHARIVAALQSLDASGRTRTEAGDAGGDGSAYASKRDPREFADCIEYLTDETLTYSGAKPGGGTYWKRAGSLHPNGVTIYGGGVHIGSTTLQGKLREAGVELSAKNGTTETALWAAAHEGESLAGADAARGDRTLPDLATGTLADAFANAQTFTSESDANAWAQSLDPADFFDKHGLRALYTAMAVEAGGRLGSGTDNRTWRYTGGVWLPDAHVVARRTVALLGDRHRKSHTGTVEQVTGARCHARGDVITGDPVGQYINVRNGLLDWRTGILGPHTPDVRSTVQLPVTWDPGARCTQFRAWLASTLPADCAGLAFDVIAYLIYSGNPFHKAVMLEGTGRNGKSTYLGVVRGIIGKHNTSAVDLASLAGNRFAAAGLVGKLANICGDIDATYLESTAIFKKITGGDLVTAEHKGRDAFEFIPWAVPVYSANKVPASADTSEGYLSRWVVLPFPHTFTGREDRTLEPRLAAEYPGILAEAVRRLPALLDRGNFEIPASAAAAKEKFDASVDPVRAWRAECTAAGDWTERSRLFASYEIWVGEERRWKLSRSSFYDRLGNLPGVRDAIRNGTRGFIGIGLSTPAPPVWGAGR